jgi:integrase
MPVRRKGTRWEVRVSCGGGRRVERRLPAGATRDEAYELEARIRRELVAASLGRGDRPLSAAIDRWEADARRLKSWDKDLRYRLYLFRQAYGDWPLSSASHVADELKRGAALAGKAPATVNRYLAILRRLLRLAEDWGWLERAPSISMVPGERARSTVLTLAQVNALVLAADPRLGPMIEFAVLTGMRKAEQLALTQESIRDGAAILPDTKAGRPRAVPLPPEAARIARRHLPWGLGRENVRKLFGEARKRAGLDVRWHDLRRTYGSWLVTGGASLLAVRDLLGHSDIKTTSIYLATVRPDLVSAVGKLPRMGKAWGKRKRAGERGAGGTG